MKRLVALSVLVLLFGCASPIKTAKYTFNQTTGGACDPAPPAPFELTNQAAQNTAGASRNSGGSGNTIIIIESSAQGAKSDPDLSGMMDAAAAAGKLATKLDDVSAAANNIGAAVSPAKEQGDVEVLD